MCSEDRFVFVMLRGALGSAVAQERIFHFDSVFSENLCKNNFEICFTKIVETCGSYLV
jgi:hypothetical protein